MPEQMSQLDHTAVSANKEKLLSVFQEKEEMFTRRFIREILSLRFEGCYEEAANLIGVIKGPEIYCYACGEVIERVDRKTSTSIVTRDTTKHLESVHGIRETVA